MTREYAAEQLLKHGPLSFAQFWAITGWEKQEAQDTLKKLADAKRVRLETYSNADLHWIVTPA